VSEIDLLKGVRVFDVSQGMAQGARHMAQGKNNQTKFILSLSFMPCASSAGKAIQL
jgi:hypothetical protein